MSSGTKKNSGGLLSESFLTSEQHKAIAFIVNNDKGVVIAPTGVGKTVISLTAIAKTGYKYIVAAPPKVIANWPKESKKWEQTKHLKLTILSGTPEEREQKLTAPADILLISLNSLEWLLTKKHGATAIIIDELSKASGKQTAKLKNKTNDKIVHRIGLTATPVSDSFLKLHPMLRIIDGGKALGRNKQGYLVKYFYATDYKQYNWKLQPGSAELILDKIKHLICDVKTNKADHLPPVYHHEIEFDMPEDTRAIYNTMKKDLLIEGDSDVVAPNMAVLSGKLRQISSGFVKTEDGQIIEYDTERAKTLISVLQETPKDSALILYEYTHQRHQITQEMNKLGLDYQAVYGGYKNPEGVEAFKRGEVQYLVAQVSTLSHGVNNLQDNCAHLVFFMPCWSQDNTEQAIGRIHRQGTTAEKVDITTIVCADTVDDLVLTRLIDKAQNMTAFIKHLRN